VTTEELFAAHVALAYTWAGRKANRCPPGIYRDMLLGPALEGLWRAAHDFKPELGYAFSTYAARRVSGYMQDFLRTLDHIPKRQPHLTYPEQCSLEVIPVELAVENIRPIDHAMNAELREIMLAAINRLENRDRDLLLGLYFLGRTQLSFAEEWKRSEGRIAQIKERALVRLSGLIFLPE